ncbi:DUF447 domain-containing protein [Halalkalirubrum salinum]|uniref:DUF447 domain-containing protein n=1 Tax=Halalkalirubrum salinum TaxID=2563889 RepID=UPI001F0FBECE|nr:DUF447 domain-containing protein [Halalkalirubrum salinum]
MTAEDPAGMHLKGWPVALRGVTESIVATLGPNELWNMAALGLHAPESREDPVTATTWGNTRTKRNFERRGGGVVQFTADPRAFVDAAATIREEPESVLPSAAASVEVTAAAIDQGVDGGTEWTTWTIEPIEETATVYERVVPTINRGFGAVIDATVAASRLDVDAFETEALLDRLRYFETTVEKCGGPAERAAFERLSEVSEWRSHPEE